MTVFSGLRTGRRLGHEVHAAEGDRRLWRRAAAPLGELQRVADEVGDVLHLGTW
jgi:hypothetical protein